jgi:anaerobic selenocysteine-containing dehydrogenase
MTSTT